LPNYNLQNPNIYPRFSSKKVLQIFSVINECDNDSKEWCFLLMWMITKNCVTQQECDKNGDDYKGSLL
jgi:hypothetical protein